MNANWLNILVVDHEAKNKDEWDEEEGLKNIVQELLTTKNLLKCTYQGETMICSHKGKVIFDLNGNICELYDYSKNLSGNIAGKSESKELEFEMNMFFAMVD